MGRLAEAKSKQAATKLASWAVSWGRILRCGVVFGHDTTHLRPALPTPPSTPRNVMQGRGTALVLAAEGDSASVCARVALGVLDAGAGCWNRDFVGRLLPGLMICRWLVPLSPLGNKHEEGRVGTGGTGRYICG